MITYLTPLEALAMLHDPDRCDDFKMGIVDGRYGFEDKYFKKTRSWRRIIDMKWLRVSIATTTHEFAIIDVDGREVLRIV